MSSRLASWCRFYWAARSSSLKYSGCWPVAVRVTLGRGVLRVLRQAELFELTLVGQVVVRVTVLGRGRVTDRRAGRQVEDPVEGAFVPPVLDQADPQRVPGQLPVRGDPRRAQRRIASTASDTPTRTPAAAVAGRTGGSPPP